MADLTILVPSRGRPEAVVELARAFDETCTADTHLVFVVDEDDPARAGYEVRFAGANLALAGTGRVRAGLCVAPNEPGTMVGALNEAAIFETTMFGQPPFAVGFMGDDHRPRTRGWDTAYLDALRDLGTGIVYGNDLLQGENLPTQCAMTADIVRALGWMAPPTLRHLYVDNVWKTLGVGAGCLRYLPNVVVEHLHPLAGKAAMDDGYARVNSRATASHDEATFKTWLAGPAAADVAAVRALRPAPKRVISYTVFGRDRMYSRGALASVQLAAEHYPGWTCRVHVGDSVDQADVAELETQPNVEVVPMVGRAEDWTATMWRYYPLLDPTVDVLIFRDADSRIDAREATAVGQWLESGRMFHIMRDHPEHRMQVMGGMWGATRAGARLLGPLLPESQVSEHSFMDQVWLRDVAYPMMRRSLCLHCEYSPVFAGEESRPFPVARQSLAAGGYRFVGQGFDEHDRPRHPDHAYLVGPEEHEWRLFDEGTVPEYTTPEWYVGREHAPHLEEAGHRGRLMQTASFVAQIAFQLGARTVVDLGAGDGGLLSLLGSGLTAWGYDLMPANIDAAKERGVDVRYGDILAGDIEWADVAVCTEMLEHLVDPHGLLREVLRHSRALVCSSPWDERPGQAYEFHAWAWDLTGYLALVRDAGWKVLRQRKVDRFQVILAVRP